MQLKSEVFPAPFGPMTAVIAPAGTSKETSLSALSPPNASDNPRIERLGGAAGRLLTDAVPPRHRRRAGRSPPAPVPSSPRTCVSAPFASVLPALFRPRIHASDDERAGASFWGLSGAERSSTASGEQHFENIRPSQSWKDCIAGRRNDAANATFR